MPQSLDTQIDSVIGFDLGDGESALATCPVSNDSEPVDLKVVDQSPSFLTCVAHDARGEILLGSRAVEATTAAACHITFKCRPDSQGPHFLELAGTFFREVLKRAHAAGVDLSRSLITVGHPAGWRPPEVKAFTSSIRGGETWSVTSVPEPRAAFLQFKDGGKLTARQLQQAVLILDIGSSTTDVTVMVNLFQQPIEFGHNALGGRLIDRLMVRRYVEDGADRAKIEEILDKHPHIYAKCEYACRRAKEKFFDEEEFFRSTDERVRCLVELDSERLFRPAYLAADIDSMLDAPLPELDGSGWRDAYRTLLEHVRERCAASGVQPQTIAMTGGGSRMEFTRRICREVFPEATLAVDVRPHLTIACGLARAGRWELRHARFLAELDAVGKRVSEAFRSTFDRFLEETLGPLSNDFARQVVRQGMLDWREGRVATLDEIEVRLQVLGNEWGRMETARSIIQQGCRKWTAEALREITPQLESVCNRYGLPMESLAIDFDSTAGINATHLSAARPGDFTQHVALAAGMLATVVSIKVTPIAMTAVMATLLKGTLLASLLAGPMGLIVMGTLTVGAFFLGKDKAESVVRSAELPLMLRSMILTDAKLQAVADDAAVAARGELAKVLPEDFKNEFIAEASGVARGVLQQRMQDALILIKA